MKNKRDDNMKAMPPKIRNKKAQFYIVASVLIVLALFGMAGISTYAVIRPEPRAIYDLSSDLSRESYEIIEYGIYNKENLTSLTDNFIIEDIEEYFLKKTDNTNITFVYGNKTELHSLRYIEKHTGDISVAEATIKTKSKDYEKTELKKDNKDDDDNGDEFVEIEIAGNKYFFEIKDNEMFYFVIAQKREQEQFIEKSEKLTGKRPGGGKRKIKEDK